MIKYSDFIWQPNLMLLASLIALLFLIISHQKRKIRLLQISLILISFAVVLHNSAIPWLLLFLLFSLIILKKSSLVTYLKTFSLVPLSLIIFHSPLIFFYLQNKSLLLTTELHLAWNFAENLGLVLKAFYLNTSLSMIFFIPALILFFLKKITKKDLIFSMLLFFPIIAASFLEKIRLHYLILSIPIFSILIGRVIDSLTNDKLLKTIIALVFIFILSGNLYFLKELKFPLENYKNIENMTNKISSKMQDKSFQVFSLIGKDTFYYPLLDTILLVPLEQKLERKLTEISDLNGYNHIQIGNINNILLFCIQLENSLCKKSFLKLKPSYSFEEIIYHDPNYSVLFLKSHQ